MSYKISVEMPNKMSNIYYCQDLDFQGKIVRAKPNEKEEIFFNNWYVLSAEETEE